MSAADTLYEQDFVAWAEREAATLRRLAAERPDFPLDWENLAEEIESLSRSDAAQLRRRLQLIVEHLLKLRLTGSELPRPGWRRTIREQRRQVSRILQDSPSLRPRVASLLARAIEDARESVADLLHTDLAGIAIRDATARLPAAAAFDEAQVLGDWWPETPDAQ